MFKDLGCRVKCAYFKNKPFCVKPRTFCLKTASEWQFFPTSHMSQSRKHRASELRSSLLYTNYSVSTIEIVANQKQIGKIFAKFSAIPHVYWLYPESTMGLQILPREENTHSISKTSARSFGDCMESSVLGVYILLGK